MRPEPRRPSGGGGRGCIVMRRRKLDETWADLRHGAAAGGAGDRGDGVAAADRQCPSAALAGGDETRRAAPLGVLDPPGGAAGGDGPARRDPARGCLGVAGVHWRWSGRLVPGPGGQRPSAAHPQPLDLRGAAPTPRARRPRAAGACSAVRCSSWPTWPGPWPSRGLFIGDMVAVLAELGRSWWRHPADAGRRGGDPGRDRAARQPRSAPPPLSSTLAWPRPERTASSPAQARSPAAAGPAPAGRRRATARCCGTTGDGAEDAARPAPPAAAPAGR